MERAHEPVEVTETVSPRPYARLLTMLGEQLIRNERIALAEIVKNAYDADATRVEVSFHGFDAADVARAESTITIRDDGLGMTESVVREHWLNPATPIKRAQKAKRPRTARGRVIQGEKGIGRFAIFKIGSRATIVTRAAGTDEELVVEYDLRFLDEDQASDEAGGPRFLDEVPVTLTLRSPRTFPGHTHGTWIEIGSLRVPWGWREIVKTFQEISRLQPLPLPRRGARRTGSAPDFEVHFFRGSEMIVELSDTLRTRFEELFEDRAVLRVSGEYDAPGARFNLTVNGEVETLDLHGASVAALGPFRRYFRDKLHPRSIDGIEAGPFEFAFFVFDFTSKAPAQYRLDTVDKALLREHRIYLYRDDVRVLPYGDPDDDWLQLDVIRGTQAAGRILGNDQTVGFVWISQADNPRLQDKTNREGLIDSGRAAADLVALLQTLLAYLRFTHYQRYLSSAEQREHIAGRRGEEARSELRALVAAAALSPEGQRRFRALETELEREREYLALRAERTEDLAGVGLSVEAASHDIVAAAERALRAAQLLRPLLSELIPGNPWVLSQLQALADDIAFVSARLADIQGLFVSTRRGVATHSVVEFARRVQRMFAAAVGRLELSVHITSSPRDLVVTTTDAALLQVLINLFDNAVYWLDASSTEDPRIAIVADSISRTVTFADNGPGVRRADAPYIFEPFYSGKGDVGKGLGLYIARQVGLRGGFAIDLVEDEALKILPGANFVLQFRGGKSVE